MKCIKQVEGLLFWTWKYSKNRVF